MTSETTASWQTALTVLQEVHAAVHPGGRHAMTVVIDYPPGSAGAPPHRHPSGPAFGYVLEGEMLFELEGEPPRVIRAGEAFWEPGGDVIHYSDGNNRDDINVPLHRHDAVRSRSAHAHPRRRRGTCRTPAPARSGRVQQPRSVERE